MDDGQEVEVEDDDEEQEEGSAKRGHRRQKKTRFMDSVAVTPKRRTATEKFLETTSILWGTGLLVYVSFLLFVLCLWVGR